MRIMLMWPSGAPEMRILIEELQKAGHVIVYWVGEHAGAHFCPKGAIFHDHYDAWDAKSAEAYKDETVKPPSADLIASMYELESLILTMMNKRYDRSPVDERKHIYYTMLAYWAMALDRSNPDILIFNDVPHSLYSNVAYTLAQKKGIKTLMLEGTTVEGRTMIYTDMWKGPEGIARKTKEYVRNRVTAGALGIEMQNYWRENTNTNDVAPRWYIQAQESQTKGVDLIRIRIGAAIKAFQSGTFLKLFSNYLQGIFRTNLKFEYEKVAIHPDFSHPFVYFGLNFQPERTTSPQGGIFHDQILAAETLAAALPEGWKLYIKEHPSQWYLRSKTRYTSARFSGYYRRLASIRNTYLISMDTPGRLLVSKASAVATITGSTGWEALLWGKQPIVFGLPWYRDCPGVLRVSDVDGCAAAVQNIMKSAGDPEQVIPFLKALDENSIKTNNGVMNPRFTPTEEMKAIAHGICATLPA